MQWKEKRVRKIIGQFLKFELIHTSSVHQFSIQNVTQKCMKRLLGCRYIILVTWLFQHQRLQSWRRLEEVGGGWRRLERVGGGWKELEEVGRGWRRLEEAEKGWRRLKRAGEG